MEEQILPQRKIFVQIVWINKYNNQKCVTIPYDSGIEKGDYVLIKKYEPKEK
jgi:hypothetical protein